MEAPFKLYLPSKNQPFLTGTKWKRARGIKDFLHLRSKLFGSYNIKFLRRSFSGFTFYLDQTIYFVKRAVLLRVVFTKPSLIFMYVVDGELHSADQKESIIRQRQGFAHLVPPGEYNWLLHKGKMKIIYFTLKPEWLMKMKSEFPELVTIARKIMDGHVTNKTLPHYHLTVKTLKHLKKLMRTRNINKIQLESELLHTINMLVNEYQQHLVRPNQISNKSNKQIAYEVRDHIIDLVERGILPFVMDVSTNFNIESRTLGRLCYGAFRMNAQELITDAQMKKAYNNLKNGALVKEVALSLGYSEAATFSRRFKDYFGYSPVEIISNTDT